MSILAGLNNLLSVFRPSPRKQLPYLPPEIKAQILDHFQGTPRDYLSVMQVDRAWRAAAAHPVTLGNFLGRNHRQPCMESRPAQRRVFINLLVAPRNLRNGGFILTPISRDALAVARAAALKRPRQRVPALPNTDRVSYAANGQWAISVQGSRGDASLSAWDLTQAQLVPIAMAPVTLSFRCEGAAISDDGNTVLLHGGQQDLVWRSTNARAGMPYQLITLFDGDFETWRTCTSFGGAAKCTLAPSGNWAVIDLGVGPSMHLWDLRGQRPKRRPITNVDFWPMKSTLFFNADETRLYFDTLSHDQARYLDFGV